MVWLFGTNERAGHAAVHQRCADGDENDDHGNQAEHFWHQQSGQYYLDTKVYDLYAELLYKIPFYAGDGLLLKAHWVIKLVGSRGEIEAGSWLCNSLNASDRFHSAEYRYVRLLECYDVPPTNKKLYPSVIH